MNRSFAALLLIAIWVSGCSSVRLVDSDVTTHSSLAAVQPGAGYRFERLPSQQVQAERQAALERTVAPLLARAGLSPATAGARYSVLLSARTQREPRAPWDDPYPGPGGHEPLITSNGGVRWVLPMMRMDSPWYRREVSVLVRDLNTQQLVFESHASHEGRWADNDAVLPAMFEAALRGFPNPPAGPRRVPVEIPG